MEEKHMLDEGKRFTRRLLFGMGALASGAAAMSLADRRAAAKARETADNFPFARTDEADLSAGDETLPQRARDLIRIGEIGIAREDKAAMTAPSSIPNSASTGRAAPNSAANSSGTTSPPAAPPSTTSPSPARP
jgi:hypothetical protein